MGGGTVRSTGNRYSGTPDPITSARSSFPLHSNLSPTTSSFPNNVSNNNMMQPLLATSAQRLSHSDQNEIEDERSHGSSFDSAFWSVPSEIEVQHTVSALQSFIQRVFSSTSSIDGLRSALSQQDTRVLQSPGFQRVLDAFHLFQKVPSVQRVVASISSDRAVWDAVIKNKEVQEFRQSLNQGAARMSVPEGSNEESDLVSMILRWILDNMKLKVVELVELLKSMVGKSFTSARKEDTSSGLKSEIEEMICSTVLLSTITLMIVLVSRAY